MNGVWITLVGNLVLSSLFPVKRAMIMSLLRRGPGNIHGASSWLENPTDKDFSNTN